MVEAAYTEPIAVMRVKKEVSMVEAVHKEPTAVVRVETEVSMVEALRNKEPTAVVRVEKEVRMVEAVHKEPTAVVRVEGERHTVWSGKCPESPVFHYGDEPDQWKGVGTERIEENTVCWRHSSGSRHQGRTTEDIARME